MLRPFPGENSGQIIPVVETGRGLCTQADKSKCMRRWTIVAQAGLVRLRAGPIYATA